jgi:hypothetical protein
MIMSLYSATSIQNFDYGKQNAAILYTDCALTPFPVANCRTRNASILHFPSYQLA